MACLQFVGLKAAFRVAGLDEASIACLCVRWSAEVAPAEPRADGVDTQGMVDEAPTGPCCLVRCVPVNALHGSRPVSTETQVQFGRSVRVRFLAGHGARIDHPAEADARDPEALESALDYSLGQSAVFQGATVFHGTCVVSSELGVLALGSTRSGKSTLAAAAVRSGWRLVSDDLVLAGKNASGRFLVRSLSPDLVLRADSLGVLAPEVAPDLRQVRSPWETKWTLARDGHAGAFQDAALPDVLWALRLDRRLQASRVRRLSQAEALAALIKGTNSLFLSERFPFERALLLPLLREMAETLPAFQVTLGRRLLREPEDELRRLVASTGS